MILAHGSIIASSQPGLFTPEARPVVDVSLSQVLAAMSRALDLTEGQSVGHTVRATIIGMRLADESGLSAFEKVALYGALLLKDSGSAGGSRVSEILDEGLPAEELAVEAPETGQPAASMMSAAQAATRGAFRDGMKSLLHKSRRSVGGRLGSPVVLARAARGESMALRMGFSSATGEAIRHIDEHWDGSGSPEARIGHEIPLSSRIILLAQTLEAFQSARGVAHALRIARERSEKWFDPALVRIARSWREDAAWWESLHSPDATAMAVALEPGQHSRYVDEKGLDEVARAFAEIIDSRSAYTYRHSTNVAKYARATGFELGFEKGEAAELNRAALLHDLGKLGVSTRILDKAGPMTDAEREEMQRHPLYTWDVLKCVNAFASFSRTAALHHEKLDGTGYPWGVKADEMDIASRVLCVADMYEALTANRPYRAGLSRDVALKIIREGIGAKVCPMATEALTEATRHIRVSMSA
ncbi:MAG: HD domain-containing phosphohydrolase [Gemmatimonadaceae bacterium]